MSWLNEGLSPAILSHLTGQIKNFTQEVLSDGIINEIDDRSKNLEKANEECNQLKELLNSKDTTISVLRKQNSELQRAVVELRAKTNDSANNGLQIESEDEGAFFWDPPPVSKSRDIKVQTKLLQKQLEQATLKIQELELELIRVRKLNSSNMKDDANFKEEGPSVKSEASRAKQDVMNSVIQMDEKIPVLETKNKQFYNVNESKKVNLEEEGKVHCNRDVIEMSTTQDRENKLRLRIEELEAENRSLSSSIEELDKQNAEFIERVLSIKEKIKKEHQFLQNAYEHLYVEHNQALYKIENLNYQQEQYQQELVKFQKSSAKTMSDSTVQTLILPKVDKETEIYLSLEDKETEVDLNVHEKLDSEGEIEKVKHILKDVSFETLSDKKHESIFVSLAQQFVDLKLKEEALENQLMEQSSELMRSQDLQKSLQTNCESMQKKIESMLSDTEHLTNLPSKIKASEKHIFSLEKEIESLQEEITTLLQINSHMCKELNSFKITNEESVNVDLSSVKIIMESKLMTSKVKNSDESVQVNLDDNKSFSFIINILKSQLRESSEIIDIMENIKLEIEYASRQINEFCIQSELNNINEENVDSNTNRLKETKNMLFVFTDLYKKIDNDITRRKHLDSKCQKLIAEIKENGQDIIFNENDNTNKTLKYTDDYVIYLENENQLLVKKVLQIDHLQKENEKSKEQIEKFYEQQKLQETENNLQKELTIKYQTEFEKFKTLQDENQKLKSELDKFSIEKCDTEVNTDDITIENISSNEFLINKEHSNFEKSNEIETLKLTIARDKESALMARETVENLSQLISSKDNEIVKMNLSHNMLKNERDKLIKLVQEKHNESLQYHSEIQRLTQLLNEQTTNLQKLIAEKDTKLATLHQKESQLLWTQNELQVVKQRLQNIEETNNFEECCGIAEHTLLSNQVLSLEEKNNIMEAAILQDQSNIRYLQEQLTDSQNKEVITLKEVERLRNHLVEIEANYTEEALQTEEIQRTLEAKLIQVEEKLKNSSTLYTSASIRANQQVETLQQQLTLIVQQRDDLQNKISSTEDKVLSYSASLTNLQLVLEQFQRDKDKDIQIATEKLRMQLQDSFQRQDDLANEITDLRDQLAEAKECLRAASRLTEQLERKSERIEQLNQEVNRLTELASTADQRIEKANKSGEGKVDRSLIKNLLLGYLSSPSNDKISVLRVFANVLDFNETECENCGLNGSIAKNSWFSSVINNTSISSKEQEASLSSAFIKFLESESQPKPQLPALPISNSSISKPGHSRQHSSSSTQSTLLFSNVILPTFPDFVPARNTGSILKEVLKDS